MAQVALAVAVAFLQGVLHRAANATWDDLWAKIFEGVAAAERKWEGQSQKGSAKRIEVITYVVNWIDERTPLNIIEKWVVRLLVGNVADALVAEINDQMGKDWVKKANQMEEHLAELLPVIE